MQMNRRDFLKTMGAVGSASLLGEPAEANEGSASNTEFVGVLVDTTVCIGCRSCEEACAEANGLPVPDIDSEGWDDVFQEYRNPSVTQYSVVNQFGDDEEIYVKKQCMHCNQPACAAACLTKAMLKTEEGPVIWREDKCMGCRFCMLSCPFNIPAFEYEKPVPSIVKCHLCFEALKEGDEPACVETCPEEAIVFGPRRELLDEARTRIYSEPDKYVHHIYGEHEAGGTGWMYLSAVPFDQLGFNTDIEMRAYPQLAKGFLYSVAVVFLLWPPFLLGLSRATQGDSEGEEEGDHQ